MNHNEKNVGKNVYTDVCVQLIHVAAQKKLTQLCKSTTLQLENLKTKQVC